MEEVDSMQGQWLGGFDSSSESNTGHIIVNIDEAIDCYCYHIAVFMWPSNNQFPALVAEIRTKNRDSKQKATAYINPIDPKTGFRGEWEEVKQYYDKDMAYPSTAEVELELKDNTLHIIEIVDTDSKFSCDLKKSNKNAESKVIGEPKSWDEFKKSVSGMKKDSKFLFRGQQQPWKLRTAFHRGERYIISNFINNDVNQLHKRLSASTKHYFDLSVPEQNGAFINLLQHHGYPTPLLDWSYSPYVAAFFAFRDLPLGYKGEEEEKVRIYIFDNATWQRKYKQSSILDPLFLHLSVMESISIDNPRLVPQQSVTTFTNIDDIEAYVLEIQKRNGDEHLYLRAIDIPASDRETAMDDFRFMGITAGSMFPGIEGACEELREQNFKV